MPIEKDIVNRTPIRDELRSGESVIVKDEYGEVYEATNIDGIIYRTPLIREDEPLTHGVFTITEDGDGEVTGGDDGAIVISPNNNTLIISDNEGNSRVILGRTSSTPTFGIRIQDHNEAIIAQVEGTTSTTATIAGWNIDPNFLEKSGVRLNAVTDNGYLGIGATTYDENDGIWLGEYTAGSFRFSMKNTDGSKYIKFDNTDLTVAAGNFSIDSSGNITATGGTIAGWDLGTNLLRSTTDGLRRIELNKAENRVSIFDDTNEKIIMGYLDGVEKNPINGYATAGSTTTLTDSTATWTTNEHAGATVTLTAGTGSSQSPDYRRIASNTATVLTHVAGGNWSPVPNATTEYSISDRSDYGVGDYGFWAKAGDQLYIDGNVQYSNGDWIIEHDASYLVNDSDNNTIIRLGTDTGQKGLFLYNTSGTTLAKFHSSGLQMGDSAGEHILVDTTIKFKNSSTVLGELNGTTLTLGQTTNNYVKITTSAVEIYNADSKKVIDISGTGSGNITIGDTTTSNTDHSEISDGNLIFNHYQGSDKHTLPYMFAQYIPEDKFELGAAGTFTSDWDLANMPSQVDYDVIFIPKLLQFYSASDTGSDQSMGYEVEEKSTTGFKPIVKRFVGSATPVTLTDSTWTDEAITKDTSNNAAHYAYNTAIEAEAGHNIVNNPFSGSGSVEVNKLTINLTCENPDDRPSEFGFLVRLGQGNDAGSSTYFESTGYKEFTHYATVMGGEAGTTPVSLVQSWDDDSGVFNGWFLFSVDWFQDIRAHVGSTVAVVDAIYQRTPVFSTITGTDKCAALVVGF
jgi:hypothetical protein